MPVRISEGLCEVSNHLRQRSRSPSGGGPGEAAAAGGHAARQQGRIESGMSELAGPYGPPAQVGGLQIG